MEQGGTAGFSSRFIQRARERFSPTDVIFILPAVGYSAATLESYVLYKTFLEFLPAVFLLAAVPLMALIGSSRDTTRPWVPFVAIMLCYETLWGTVATSAATNALYSVYSLDKMIWGFNVTGWVQATFYSPTMTLIATSFYSLHLPLVAVTSGALWYFSRKTFSKFVTAMVLTSYAALVTFILLPTAPPWYQGVAGDLFYGGTSSALPASLLNVVSFFESDKFAAFPSLHAAYAIIFSYFMIKLDRRLAIISLPVTFGVLFSTVYLGQHYVIDLLAGAAYALVPCLIAEKFQIVSGGKKEAAITKMSGVVFAAHNVIPSLNAQVTKLQAQNPSLKQTTGS